jgi:hypothetical protein
MAGVEAFLPFLFDASDFASVDNLLRCFRAAVTRGEDSSLALRCKVGQVKLHFKPSSAARKMMMTRARRKRRASRRHRPLRRTGRNSSSPEDGLCALLSFYPFLR